MRLGEIPAPAQSVPVLTPPPPARAQETYSAVVTQVPVKELLFALARDAKINIDVENDVTGTVTLNAVDQTLAQILERISRQVDIRYELHDGNLVVQQDRPFLKTYRVDYLNLARDNASTVNVATQIATTGQAAGDAASGGNNNSTTSVTSTSNNRFWQTLGGNVATILGETADEHGHAPSVIVNAESGLLSVTATSRQHRRIQAYLDQVLASAQRQVLIEATVVEVQLNDDYTLGVDWSRIAEGNGLSIDQSLLGTNLKDPPFTQLTYADPESGLGNIAATVRMLQQFGTVKVLSSPKVMAINNQTAVLKVVDNLVYFTVEADTTAGQGFSNTTFTTTVHTVPVGFVMAVTPQINDNRMVILNVRPTISRVIDFVSDPNPSLALANVESLVPQIQVRELDSVLRVTSGQVAVLGGLIQDTVDLNKAGIPGLSRLPGVGDVFALRKNRIVRSELVIFLRPVVVSTPDVDTELAEFRRFLPYAPETEGAIAGERP